MHSLGKLLYRKLFLSGTVLCVLLSFGSVFAEPSIKWTRTFGNASREIAYSVIQTQDGGYAVAGSGLLVKTDMFGNMEWNQTFSGTCHSLVNTSDGGYALACEIFSSGTKTDALLIKIGASGNIEWNKTYGGTWYERAYSVVATSDGGYAIAGDKTIYVIGSPDQEFWLIKTDEFGEEEWNRTYGEPEKVESARSLVECSGGGYALVGSTLFVKTDALGDMLWNKTIGGTCSSVVETSEGEYVIAGDTAVSSAGSQDFMLLKIDASGNLLWSRTYGGAGDDRAKSLVKTSEGGFALAGVKDSVTQEWEGYPISGNFWLVKTDASGIMEWNQQYGGAGGEYAYSLVQTLDGGYALAGETGSFGAGGSDFWLVKTDETGFVPEYSSWLIPSLLLVATLVIVICKNKLFSQSSKK